MASQIKFQSVSAANLQAPDVTKAGAIFSGAIQSLAKTVKGVEIGRQEAATDDVKTNLRNANNQSDLQDIKTTQIGDLADLGVDGEQLDALTGRVQNKQTDVFGRALEDNYNNQTDRNSSAVQRILAGNPDLGRSVQLDSGGNFAFSAPNENLSAQQIEEDKVNFFQTLRDSAFKPVNNERQQNKQIREEAKAFNATPEQTNKLVSNFKSFKDGLKSLTDEDQLQVNQVVGQNQADLDQEIEEINFQKRTLEDRYQITQEEARTELNTKRQDVEAWVTSKLPTELNFLYSFFTGGAQKGGQDIKEYFSKIFNGKITKFKDHKVQPWMLQRALSSTVDLEADGRPNIDISDFEDRLLELAKDKDMHKDMRYIANSDVIVKRDIANATARASIRNKDIVAEFKRSTIGIRDPNRNAKIFQDYFNKVSSLENPLEASVAIANAEKRITAPKTAQTDPTTIEPSDSFFEDDLPPADDGTPADPVLAANIEAAEIFDVENSVDVGNLTPEIVKQLAPEQIGEGFPPEVVKSLDILTRQAYLNKLDTSKRYGKASRQVLTDAMEGLINLKDGFMSIIDKIFSAPEAESNPVINPQIPADPIQKAAQKRVTSLQLNLDRILSNATKERQVSLQREFDVRKKQLSRGEPLSEAKLKEMLDIGEELALLVGASPSDIKKLRNQYK